jgi:DNA-directed RNA polymerase sigma subunit (sigma70/sigma32)
LALRFGIGQPAEHTLAELGDAFKISREWARKIKARALRKLRRSDLVQALRSFLES